MIKTINSISDICNLALNGCVDWREYGDVSVREKDGLLLFNYTNAAQYKGEWNFFERVSRGLIIDRLSGRIVARPFDKFFNWMEGGRKSSANIKTITEKLDGSLGILYKDRGFKITTKGSFDSAQSLWATRFLSRNHSLNGFDDDYTLLFEIIYPCNRIVVDYVGWEGLVLLAARNRLTGEYLTYPMLTGIAHRYGFPVPKRYDFSNIADILTRLPQIPHNEEGWVVEFEDGTRFKFKGDDYLAVHKIIHSISFKNTLAAYTDNRIDAILECIPDEFMEEIQAHLITIAQVIKATKLEVESVFDVAPKHSRKEFATWAIKNHKNLAPYLFAVLDGKDIMPLILKIAFAEMVKSEAGE